MAGIYRPIIDCLLWQRLSYAFGAIPPNPLVFIGIGPALHGARPGETGNFGGNRPGKWGIAGTQAGVAEPVDAQGLKPCFQ